MIEEMPKKKSLFKNIKKPTIYITVVALLLVLGISYGLVYFIHNEELFSGNLTSAYLNINVSSNGSITLNNAVPLSDNAGLSSENFEVLNITNTSNMPITLKLNLESDDSSTIDISNIRYGLYINNNLHKVDYVPNNGNLLTLTLLEDEEIELKVYMWLDYNYTDSGTYFKGNFDIETTPSEMLGVEYLKSSNLTKIGTNGNVTTTDDNIRDYRYTGETPNNYVWFNCDNNKTSGSSYCEKWQIVGIENVSATTSSNSYERIKLVKEDNNVDDSNMLLMPDAVTEYLNEDYYNELKDTSKSMIMDALFNIGETSITSNASTSYTAESSTKEQYKVGLLSLSDFGYSSTNSTSNLNDATLYSNSWLKNKNYYFINSSGMNLIYNNGTSIITNNGISSNFVYSNNLKPVVYLNPLVKIIGGKGTSDSPYELKIDTNEINYQGDKNTLGLVTFNMNGIEVDSIAPIPIYEGEVITIPTIEGVAGWSTTSNGSIEYSAGDTVTLTSDTTLYAANYTASMLSYLNSNTSCTTAQCALDELSDIFS